MDHGFTTKVKPVDFAAANIDPHLTYVSSDHYQLLRRFSVSRSCSTIAIPIAATAALINDAAVTALRLELIDFTQMPSAEAAFIGALTGVYLHPLLNEIMVIRISITVPSIVIMVPGLYLYRAIYNLGIMSLNESVSWFCSRL